MTAHAGLYIDADAHSADGCERSLLSAGLSRDNDKGGKETLVGSDGTTSIANVNGVELGYRVSR